MTSGQRSAAFVLVLVATGFGAARFPVSAQGERTDDLLPALLAEMKGLRAAMEQMASGGPQAQLVASRLQIQEARLTAMLNRLEAVRDQLEGTRREYAENRAMLESLEKIGMVDGMTQGDKERMVAEVKTEQSVMKARLDRLTAEEMQLAGDVAVEQQRWIAINQRLDELERTLSKR